MTVRPPPENCHGFPTTAVGGVPLWRVTQNERSERPWWFASLPLDGTEGAGRFDLPQPRGTCYWATEPLAAVAEVLLRDASSGVLPSEIVAARTIVEAPAPDASLADLTDPDAAAYGVTNELSAGPPPYAAAQAWARALDTVSDGVHYPTRHHTSGRSCAFFGDAGLGATAPARVAPLADLRTEIEDGLRITLLDRPALADLSPLVDPAESE